MRFRRIEIRDWQQFSHIELDFHPRLTVITGANGSGKTTILRFLARHFGWAFSHLRTPYPDKVRGFRYLIGLVTGRPEQASSAVQIGEIEYDSGRKTPVKVPFSDQEAAYSLSIDNPESVAGFFIPSHRPEFRYQRVDNLPLGRRPWQQGAFSAVQQSIRNISQGGGGPSTSYHMKEVIIALAVFGPGNRFVEPDPVANRLYEAFQETLRQVLPPELGFQSLAVRDRSEVVLVTNAGDFLLDAVSGGVAALVELAWQIFMFAPPDGQSYVVVIDEPENHLHAAMQRRLMPNFVEAFPLAQFVIATHSPLVVGSVRDSHVYALRFSGDHRVTSERLDLYDKAGSAEQVLREVLDVDVSMPIWAETALQQLIERYLAEPLSVESARRLRAEMIEAGLTRWLPQAVVELAERQAAR